MQRAFCVFYLSGIPERARLDSPGMSQQYGNRPGYGSLHHESIGFVSNYSLEKVRKDVMPGPFCLVALAHQDGDDFNYVHVCVYLALTPAAIEPVFILRLWIT